MLLEIPAFAIKEKINKRHQNWKGIVKLYCLQKIILYLGNTKSSIKKLLELIHKFSKYSGYTICKLLLSILQNYSKENSMFSSVQLLSCVQLFVTLWTAARQASLSITNSRSPPKPMSIELVMPSNHLILCHALLLLPSIFPSIRVFSNESTLWIRWSKYWSFSFSISPSNEHPELISLRMDWLDLLAV